MWLPYPPYRETGTLASARARGGLCVSDRPSLIRKVSNMSKEAPEGKKLTKQGKSALAKYLTSIGQIKRRENIVIGTIMAFVALGLGGLLTYYLELYFWYVTPPIYAILWYLDWKSRR